MYTKPIVIRRAAAAAGLCLTGLMCVNAGTIAVIPPNQTQTLDAKLTNVKTGNIPYFGVCTSSITVFPIGPADQIPG